MYTIVRPKKNIILLPDSLFSSLIILSKKSVGNKSGSARLPPSGFECRKT